MIDFEKKSSKTRLSLHTHLIRRAFIDYFKEHQHTICASAPLVPEKDPSLLFTTAGMVPFKDNFTQKEAATFKTAASAQKCIRAGGKHNDLEEVGYTPRHHTFFEMLGNFSFGDYFKEKAIFYAWDFLTRILKVDPKRLWVTIYHDDEEAFALWKKIAGFGDERIIRIATDDNFWSMGDVGPCGPCTEIFYDHGEHLSGGLPGTPEEGGLRFVEIWNLVFMSFELLGEGKRIPLKSPSIDTGMGLERIAAVLQNTHDNFEIDLFRTIIDASVKMSGKPKDGSFKVTHRVLADHLRSCSFLIAEGVFPANEGRGYVLRRILRRALRHVHHLEQPSDHFAQLVPFLVQEMGDFYPELRQAESLIQNTLKEEGKRFDDLLKRGLVLLTQGLSQVKNDIFPGALAFQLYDTYGFPLDLTADVLREKNILVDEAGFYEHMQKQRELSQKSWKGKAEQDCEEMKMIERQMQDQNWSPTSFLGYNTLTSVARVNALFVDGKFVPYLEKDQVGWMLVDQTPFYAESGGQIGDRGCIYSDQSCIEQRAIVLDVQKGFLHEVKAQGQGLSVGMSVYLEVDCEHRASTAANHSATHLLNAALRFVLGSHVMQKGSLVNPSKLRFDFSHSAPLTGEECSRVEEIINQIIWQNDAVQACVMPKQEALKSGAVAAFGEKYEDQVRVVKMGQGQEDSFSKEFCGGTHVQRTGDIGGFKITSEAGIASGIRRIEAVTRRSFLELAQNLWQQKKDLAFLLKTGPENVVQKTQELLEQFKKAQKDKSALPEPRREEIGSLILEHLIVQSADVVKSIVDQFRKKNSHIDAVLLVEIHTSTGLSFVIAVTEKLKTQHPADRLVQYLTTKLENGRGGGKADMAQAGGLLLEKAPLVFDLLCKHLQS
jgi:alanyl-tRNA synthetase